MKNSRRRKQNSKEKEKEGEEGEREKRRGEKEKEGGRKTRNRESSARDAPPSPGAFPSRKLRNNMTPIKGRLGKNTTPTCRDPGKLIKNLQNNPKEETRTSNIHPMRTPFACYESPNFQKCRKQKQQNHHL